MQAPRMQISAMQKWTFIYRLEKLGAYMRISAENRTYKLKKNEKKFFVRDNTIWPVSFS